MKKWVCGVCGYVLNGDEPPGKCPVCGADKSLFEPVIETEAETKPDTAERGMESRAIKKWRCTVCGYVHEGDEPPDKCPVCGADKRQFEPVVEEEKSTPPPRGKKKAADEEHPPVAPSPDPDPRHVDLGPMPDTPMERAYHIAIGQMLKHHAHPVSVHIPNGVLPISFIFIILALLSGSKTLEIAALSNMVFVVISMPFVLFSGYVEWKKRYKGIMTERFRIKIICAGVVAGCALVVVCWWMANPDILSAGSAGRWVFVLLNLVMLAAAVVAGLIGGKLVFRD